MSSSYLLGKKGEEIACKYLNGNKFKVLESNWRFGKLGEIDLIAIDEKTKELVFIEVKTRSASIGEAKELVTDLKKEQIIKLATSYLYFHKIKDVNCRFDVIALSIKGGKVKLEHIKRAFSG